MSNDREGALILVCDGHAAYYLDGKKSMEGDSDEIMREVLSAYDVEVRHLDDDASDGQFPEALP